MEGAAVAEGFEGAQLAVEELLHDQGRARPPLPYLGAAPDEFVRVGDEDDVLAGHALARFDHAGVGRVEPGEGGGVLPGGELGGPDGVGDIRARGVGGPDGVGDVRARGGEGAAQLGLVLGAQRGAPVLAREPEVLGGEGGLDLEVVAVGEDGAGVAAVGGDTADDLGEVPYVTGDDVEGGEGVRGRAVAFPPTIGALMGLGLVGEEGDRQAEPGRRGEEALGDGVGGVEGEEVEPGRPGAGAAGAAGAAEEPRRAGEENGRDAASRSFSFTARD
ncbi:hypothetical protein SVIO_031020 [Streptomyces violaceusniger]|uniref:Uncharacterized protein n=1 Tax=Streptomyces violaceusniger TaxID=68280 RepID=A0A4D4L361_STRVO|nr:hypothetical protein SVIO_031020 [Streptomyces violaceusniger]